MAQWWQPLRLRAPHALVRALFTSNSTGVHPQATSSALSDISEQSQNSTFEALHIVADGPLSSAAALNPIGPHFVLSGGRSPLAAVSATPASSGTSVTSQASTRNLLVFPASSKVGNSSAHPALPGRGGLKALHHHPHRTVARIEFENGIKLVKRNVFSRKPWRDGLLVMWIVATNTLTSLLVAWGVTCLYAMGSPLAPFYPALWVSQTESQDRVTVSDSQVVEFYGATGFYFVLFACISHAVPSAVLASRRVMGFSENRTIRPQGFRRSLTATLSSTWHALVLALAAGTAFMVLMALQHVPFREYGRMHLYAMCAIAYFYALFADAKKKAARRMRVQEIRRALRPAPPLAASAAAPSKELTGVSLIQPSAPSANPTNTEVRGSIATSSPPPLPPLARRPSRSQHFCRIFVHVAAFSVVFLYLHVASVLRLAKQWELLLFASMSLLLKISIQEVAKHFQLSARRKPSVRAVHLVMTVPTIAIDAQIRMVFIQNGGGQSIVASSIAIVFCEIFFRIFKILRLRYSITKRLAECKGMQRLLERVNSKLTLRDVSTARAEYAEFLDWKNYVLRLHAAEVYADMHGEYISIGLSTAVVLIMGDHPMFDLSAITQGGRAHHDGQRILAALFQIGTGLAFDYISSVVEGVHEVPLYESIADGGTDLRVFLHVLLSTLTAVNIGIIGLFYIKASQ